MGWEVSIELREAKPSDAAAIRHLTRQAYAKWVPQNWRRFLRQGAKVGPSTRRTIAYEDPEAFYGRVQGQGRA
jgi:hypothetical protein